MGVIAESLQLKAARKNLNGLQKGISDLCKVSFYFLNNVCTLYVDLYRYVYVIAFYIKNKSNLTSFLN